MIEAGRITINGRIAKLGDTVGEDDAVFVDNNPVAGVQEHVYVAYNKPKGVEVTANQAVNKNIKDELNFPYHIFPVGRLDKDSSGLLLLTNDGEAAQTIMRPENHLEKEYLVHVDRAYEEDFLKQLAVGVKIDGKQTRGTTTWRQNKKAFKIILTEGKNRQIRKMTEKLGYTVVALKRVRIMNVKLGKLKSGEWRPLSKKEVTDLQRGVSGK